MSHRFYGPAYQVLKVEGKDFYTIKPRSMISNYSWILKFRKISYTVSDYFLKKRKRGPISCSQGCMGEESPGANQGQNDAVSLHQPSRGMFCLRGTDRS